MEYVINGADDGNDDILMAHLDDFVDTYSILVDPAGSVFKTHGVTACGNYEGGSEEHCAIHNPSDHHMVTWPAVFRMDKFALIERECEHGIGHPDPDSLEYFDQAGITGLADHHCDLCCHSGQLEITDD